MMRIKKFVFSPFQENSYVVYTDAGNGWIIDPGCYFPEEKEELKNFLTDNKITPTRLLNTHCHLDHIFGNRFVCDTYNLLPEYHSLDLPTLGMAAISAKMYGVNGFEESPKAKSHLDKLTELKLDDQLFRIVFVPGHAPGHVAFIHDKEKLIIGGDVLFRGSIGRTDLPGGSMVTLLQSIKSEFFTLADDFVVYSGHGEETTIGYEKKHNPFLT
jgi:hydroxyacylglutathione hydrolase